MNSTPILIEDSARTSMYAMPEEPEPFGDTPYLDMIGAYAAMALNLRQDGADMLVLRDMRSLPVARAAVLGARHCGLPVYVSLPVTVYDKPVEEEKLLAALLCLQELDIAAFGLDFDYVTGEVLELFSLLSPYAKVPLLARPAGATGADRFASLLQAGADVLCCQKTAPGQVLSARDAIRAAVAIARPPRPEDAPLLLCDQTGVYYLEEDFTVSEEIDCSRDMSEEILDGEDDAVDALCFHVTSVDDAHHLGGNVHMVRCAVCILAESEEALEMALALYSGRALVDARSDVPEEALATLAGHYGAIVR